MWMKIGVQNLKLNQNNKKKRLNERDARKKSKKVSNPTKTICRQMEIKLLSCNVTPYKINDIKTSEN